MRPSADNVFFVFMASSFVCLKIARIALVGRCDARKSLSSPGAATFAGVKKLLRHDLKKKKKLFSFIFLRKVLIAVHEDKAKLNVDKLFLSSRHFSFSRGIRRFCFAPTRIAFYFTTSVLRCWM